MNINIDSYDHEGKLELFRLNFTNNTTNFVDPEGGRKREGGARGRGKALISMLLMLRKTTNFRSMPLVSVSIWKGLKRMSTRPMTSGRIPPCSFRRYRRFQIQNRWKREKKSFLDQTAIQTSTFFWQMASGPLELTSIKGTGWPQH